MSEYGKELLELYLSRGALAFGEFQLAGGGQSDFYIDGRLITTLPQGLRIIAAAVSELVTEKGLCPPGTTIVAPAISGIAVAVATALQLDIPYVIDRGKAKQHGARRRFEGRFDVGNRALVVDDLATVGSTLIATVSAIQEMGRDVTDAIVVVDRQEGASEALGAMGVRLHSVVSGTLLRTGLREELAKGQG